MATCESPSIPTLPPCSICLAKYNIPKILSCGHSFCLQPCLSDLLKTSTPECPLCRQEIELPASRLADDFPTNFALQSLSEAHDQIEPLYVQQTMQCSTHDSSKVEYYCETCSQALCKTCLNEPHNETHEILPTLNIIEKYCKKVKNTQEILNDVDKRLTTLSNLLVSAKKNVEEKMTTITDKIDQAKISMCKVVNDEAEKLKVDVEKSEEAIFKQFSEYEARQHDLSFCSESNRALGESLIRNFKTLNFGRIRTIQGLTSKVELLAEDISVLERNHMPEKIEVDFLPLATTKVPLGCVISSNSPVEEICLKLLIDIPIELKYIGFGHLASNSLVLANKDTSVRNSENITCTWYPLKSSGNRLTCKVQFIASKIKYHFNAGIYDQTLLASVDFKMYKINLDFNDQMSNLTTFRLPDANIIPESAEHVDFSPELQAEDGKLTVLAVTWDETRQDCLALLSNGVTILRSNFCGLTQSYSSIELIEEVQHVESSGFHVSTYCSMAICERDKRIVRFYAGIQPIVKTTRVVKAPPEIPDWSPICVSTRKGCNDWFVSWEINSKDIEGESFPYTRIYQYSDNFELKWLIFKVSRTTVELFC